MSKKVETMKLGSKDYAQVKDRIMAFREENPNGDIITEPTITETHILFKAYILKDKANPNSASATGHSYGEIKQGNKEKVFEKQESVAVGRALALLGYSTGGEVASSEEIEEFYAQKQEKMAELIFEATEGIGNCETVDALKTYFTSLDAELMAIPALIEAKNTKYKELTAKKDVE